MSHIPLKVYTFDDMYIQPQREAINPSFFPYGIFAINADNPALVIHTLNPR